MQDRRCVRGALVRGAPIEMVVEDGLDRAIGARADVDGALGGGFQTLGAVGTGQPNNAQTGAKALFGMRALFEDQFAQRRRRRSDQASVLTNAIDRPTGVSPVAGGHVFGDGRVLVIAARPHMRGNPFALEEDLDGSRGQPRVDLGAGEAMGNAVILISP